MKQAKITDFLPATPKRRIVYGRGRGPQPIRKPTLRRYDCVVGAGDDLWLRTAIIAYKPYEPSAPKAKRRRVRMTNRAWEWHDMKSVLDSILNE